MTRAIAILTVCILAAPAVTRAQEPPPAPAAPSLVDVAKAEEARRKSVRKPAKVYTNDNLKADNSPSRPLPPPDSPSTTVPEVNLPGGAVEPAVPEAPDTPARDQAYWSGRISGVRAALDRSRIFADSLQTRVNSLTADWLERDDPVQKERLDKDRKTALAELDRVKKEIEAQEKEIAAIEEEARRAGVPSGWLRPGA